MFGLKENERIEKKRKGGEKERKGKKKEIIFFVWYGKK